MDDISNNSKCSLSGSKAQQGFRTGTLVPFSLTILNKLIILSGLQFAAPKSYMPPPSIVVFLLENCCLSEAWNSEVVPQHSCYLRARREQNLTAGFSRGQGIKMVRNQSWGITSMRGGMAFLFSLSKSSLASGEWALCFQ